MKGKKFYLILVGLIILGAASVFFYRQQEETRLLEFEGYEISEIENRVDGLYNEEKTDIVENISKEELEELDELFIDLEAQEVSRRNEGRIKDAQLDFLMAREMNEVESKLDGLFIEGDIIDQDISLDEANDLQVEVNVYEIKPMYYERNIAILDEARIQMTDIETATEFIDSLFEEDIVIESVTRADEEEARELIEPIRNEEVKEELTSRVEIVSLALTEMEEALALEAELEALEEEELAEEDEEEELAEEFEEEEIEYTAPANELESETSDSGSSWTPPSNSWSGGSGNSRTSTGSGSTSGGSTGSGNAGSGNAGENTGGGSADESDAENESESEPSTPETPEDPVNPEPEDSENPSDEEPVEGENPNWESQR